jgi:hypothetical protein
MLTGNAGKNKDDSYKSTQLGVRYTIAPGLLLGVLHNMYEYEDKHSKANSNDGTATEIELRLNF